jgi:RNA polymerase sigma-70 factor (ECF subfamily)
VPTVSEPVASPRVYRRLVPGGHGDAIATAHRAAQAAWPDVVVEPARFAAELERRLGAELAELASFRTSDIYLAIACLDGDRAAIAHLERDFLDEVDFAAKKLGASAAVADDVRGHLRRVLFTAEPDREAALAQYAGRANLKGYLRVIASREMVRALEKGNREAPLEPLLEQLGVEHAPELDLLRARYGAEISASLRAALAGLDTRERALLRYSLVDGWTVDQIGEVYAVHRATAARWVASARDALAEGLRRHVADRLSIELDEVESLVRVVRSQIDVSLARIL